MSNMDNIINKIQAETDEKIAIINEEASKKVQAIRDEIINKGLSEKNKIISDANNRADNIFSRISENAEIRIRDQRLEERQKLIDRVFSLALKRLNSISDGDFIDQIKNVVDKIGDKNLVLKAPKSRIESLKSANLDVKIDEENFVENGFVLSSDKMNYNFKYEDILGDNREQIGPQLINFLFK